MSFFIVDRKKCCHDGACVAECPAGILKLDESHVPGVIDGGEDFCILCGHCVAVCPKGAISLESMAVEKCEPLADGWNLSLKEVSPFLKGRRSVRTFKTELVDKKTIEQLIDVARFAPSGINRQPVFWSVVYEPSAVKEVARMIVTWMRGQLVAQTPMSKGLHMDAIVDSWDKGRDRVCRGAPHLVVAYALADDMTAPQAGTIALTYFELAAAAAGLGVCWAGYVHIAANSDPALKKFLGLRSRHACLGTMLLGHPKYKYHRIPLRLEGRIKWLGAKPGADSE